jgi:hypothetical protein
MTWFISKPISAEDSDTPHPYGRFAPPRAAQAGAQGMEIL